MPEETRSLIEANGSSKSSKSEDFNKLFIDVTQKFNDRTLNTLRLFASIIGVVLIVFSVISAYSLNAERERVERALKTQEEKFEKLREEMMGLSGEPKIEILSTPDKKPLKDREIQYTIRQTDHLTGKPYFIYFHYTIRNIGNGSSGPIWVKIYLEPTGIFAGELDPDEPGYGVQFIISPQNWTQLFEKTGAIFPGHGFSSNVTAGTRILKNIPKGKYKLLVKIYYGQSGRAIVSQTESYFEILSDWIMPDNDQK